MPTSTGAPTKLSIRTTAKDQVVDITSQVQAQLGKTQSVQGVCVVFAAHTTCALTTADLDPGTDQDLLDALRALLPRQQYRHPHDPTHAPDHILSTLLGASVQVPFADRQLLLGVWQRIILVELDGPRERTVYVSVLG